MSHKFWNEGTAVLAILLLGAICGRSQTAAGAGAGKTFSSREEAGAAVLAAARSGDRQAMIAIFGPSSQAVLFTGDAATDKARLANFVSAYNQMHRLGKDQSRRPGSAGRLRELSVSHSPRPKCRGTLVL